MAPCPPTLGGKAFGSPKMGGQGALWALSRPFSLLDMTCPCMDTSGCGDYGSLTPTRWAIFFARAAKS